MTETYKLLIDSPEYPKGTTARGNAFDGIYDLYKPDGEEISQCRYLDPYQVENRPEVWELVKDKLDLRSPEAEKMREEARSKRWEFVPSTDENFSAGYFSWDFIQNNTIKLIWKKDVVDICNWNLGCVKRTKEEALAWGEKYARYFLTE